MKKIVIILGAAVLSACLLAVAESPTPTPEAGSIVDISGGVIHPNQVYTVLTYAAPREIRLADTGLRESGLTAGNFPPASDEIRVFVDRQATNSAPLARIWINLREGGSYWFMQTGQGSAEDFVIPEGAMVVVFSRASTNPVTWKNVFE